MDTSLTVTFAISRAARTETDYREEEFFREEVQEYI